MTISLQLIIRINQKIIFYINQTLKIKQYNRLKIYYKLYYTIDLLYNRLIILLNGFFISIYQNKIYQLDKDLHLNMILI